MEAIIKSKTVRFQSNKLSLEGSLNIPDGEGVFPAVIVCHPHPLYGGNMDNIVINSLCGSLARKSILTFKFNFRGVGESQGTFSIEVDVQDDVKAAISFIVSLREVNPTRMGLAGYSAGAAWGLTAACQDARIKVLAAISPPLSLFDFNILRDCGKPKYFISGNRDEYVHDRELINFCQKLAEPTECFIVQGADHFWSGYESIPGEKVAGYFSCIL
jgi:uncharacterized protein